MCFLNREFIFKAENLCNFEAENILGSVITFFGNFYLGK